ncbi:MAG: AAA family ATPase [bacterium]
MPLNCDSCGTINRDIAKYCKNCGDQIISASASDLEQLVGLSDIKNEIKSLINITSALKNRGTGYKINMHTLIIGNTGTGKNTIANVLQDLFFRNGIISKSKAEMIDAVDYAEYTKDFQNNIQKAKGWILFIDNVQKLVPSGFASDLHQLDKLFSEMDKFGSDPIVILAGLPEGFEEFLDKNPSIRNRFEYRFRLPEFTASELFQICLKRLGGYNLNLIEDSEKRLKALFKQAIKTKTHSFGNGHYAVGIAEEIFKNYLSRVSKCGVDDNIISKDDVKGDIPEEKTLEQILSEMDEFIGMDAIKNAVKEIAKQVTMQQERAKRGIAQEEKIGLHFILTGNPGTGKTSIARKLGEIFSAIEFLDSGHVVEVDRSKLVSEYQGKTPILTNDAVDKSMGGILFVDEAYTLAPYSETGDVDKYGKEAIETLMKRMEDERGKFVIIAAGYKTEMDRFLHVNSGLKSRFNKYLHIDDYKPDELFKIYHNFLKKRKYILSPEAEDTVKKAIEVLYESRDKDFGNGREMRKLFEETLARQSERLSKLSLDEQNNDVLTTIITEDIPYKAPKENDLTEVLGELNELIGMKNIKDEINNFVNFLNIEKKRKEKGGAGTALNIHFVFTGNPGTGKTTVARIIGGVFQKLGLLSKGHVVETDRSKLVGATIGSTAPKTSQVIDSAMGGVLFIDEAYSLSPDDSSFDYGKEAIDTLLKRMEDDRGKFIVIVAGYNNEMRKFMNTNPGLASRFTKKINFEDYSAEELMDIFIRQVNKKKLKLDAEANDNLLKFFKGIHLSRDKNFGNAREVRNIFEMSLQRQGNRLSMLVTSPDFNEELMDYLTREDIEGKVGKVKSLDEVLEGLNEFIGMTSVKTSIKEIALQLKMQQERVNRGLADAEKMGMHFILTGNPGTGKTTITRKLGEVFKSIGFMPKGHVVEVDRSKLVAQYQGKTPLLVNEACDQAMGGILFVDEAYTLAGDPSSGSSDPYGKEAIETLMKRMEDDRGKFVVIAAGYRNEINNFLNTNPGMKSRFDKYLHIDDYNVDELFEIFKVQIKKKKFVITEDALLLVKKVIGKLIDGKDKNFANAREVRKIVDEALAKQSERTSKLPEIEKTNDALNTITAIDIPYEALKEKSLDEVLGQLNELTGMRNIKNEINNLVNYLNIEKRRIERGEKGTQLNIHFVFTGNPGTGKTTVARIIGDVFKNLGLLSRGHVIEADRSKLVGTTVGSTAPKTNNLIDNAMGGVLFIDEAYTLSPEDVSNDFGKEAIDTLLKRMEDDRGRFVVIVAGYNNEMRKFLDTNPGLASRFTKKINFEDYTAEELMEIFNKQVKNKKLKLETEADNNLLKFFKDIYMARDKNFGNAREVRNIFEMALLRQGNRLSTLVTKPDFNETDMDYLTIEDIQGKQAKSKTLDDILSELKEFVGMDTVKTSVREIALQIKMQQERVNRGLADAEKLGMHFILTGNPGTGKTTITRKLGEVFKAIGFLSKGHVVEVDRSKLVGQYQGKTPLLVNDACNQAMGGILFVDEAYTLAGDPTSGSSDSYGKEAIETLMKRMEDDRGKFVVIAAGYKDEMSNFLDTNPGMKSRFDKYLHIDDYSKDELFAILLGQAKKKKYIIADEAIDSIKKNINKLVDSKDKNFANAREARKLFELMISKQSERVSKLTDEERTNAVLSTVQLIDVPSDGTKEIKIEDVLKELNELTGMANIKNELNSLIDFLSVEKQRAELGGTKTPLNLHFVFTGNPGTGKTTVARIIANIFKSLGLLSQGQLIEVDRSNLVGQWVGQTEPKTNKVIDKAIGGLLFIDEAYTLSSGGGNDFGKEVINILLKRMEDDRGKFIVIVAGYTNEMQQFLDTNPGLSSRFTKHIHFEDYAADELADIFRCQVKKKKLTLDSDAENCLTEYFNKIYAARDKNFGNAREVRNIFESSLQRQGARLSKLIKEENISKEDLNILTKADIEGSVSPDNSEKLNLGNLNKLVGLDSVKSTIDKTVKQIKIINKRKKENLDEGEILSYNYIITGNTGTGKNTIVNCLGEIFNSMGYLAKGHVIKADKSSLVSEFQGHTARLVNQACDNALGGILYIENAYTLDYTDTEYITNNKEAIETLITRIEADKGKYIVVLSGKKKEMEKFLYKNPRLQYLFDQRLNIEDYSKEELAGIFNLFAQEKNLLIQSDANSNIEKCIAEFVYKKYDNSSNILDLQKLFCNVYEQHNNRINKLPIYQRSEENDNTLTSQDFPVVAVKTNNVDDLLLELNGLVGLNNVKTEIRQFVNYLKLEKLRGKNYQSIIESKTTPNYNFIITGNPGTGVSTLAKIIAKILYSLDLLEKGDVMEVTKDDLFKNYFGTANAMTNEVVDKSLGCILLINSVETLQSNETQFEGDEAVMHLYKRLVEEFGRFYLILSGSKKGMDEFIAKNPVGFTSRFIKLHINDYTSDELYDIFKLFIAQNKKQLTKEADNLIKQKIEELYVNKSQKFENAKLIKNIFDKIMHNQKERTEPFNVLDPMHNTIIVEDINI